jgi:hypothetical protein
MKVWNKICFLVLAAIAMLAWAGCGGGCATTSINSTGGTSGPTGGVGTGGTSCGPGTNPGGGGGNTSSFLYYQSNTSILGAGLSTTGTFAALSPFSAPTLPSAAGSDMIVVNKKFLYLPQNDSLSIQAFSIDHTSGALTAIAGSPFSTAGADSIASDPAGRFLFAGNNNTGQISVFQIDPTSGALVVAPGFTVLRL